MDSPGRRPFLRAAIAALVGLALIAPGCGKRSSPKPTQLMSDGEDAVAQGHLRKAVAYFEQEIELNPKNPTPYLRLALIYEHVYGERAKADEYYKRYLEIETSEPMRERVRRWRENVSESAAPIDVGGGHNGAGADAALRKQLDEANRKLHDAEQANDDLAKKFIELQGVHKQLEQLQQQFAGSTATVATLTKEQADLKKLADERAETVASLTKELDDLKARQQTAADTSAEEITQLQTQITALENKNKELDARNKELDAENSRAGRRTLTKKLDEARQDLKTAEAKNAEHARTIEDLERQIARLKVQAATTTAKRTAKHVVRQGETLSAISLKYYGTRDRWREIHEANRDIIPDPDRIPAGLELIIFLDDAQ